MRRIFGLERFFERKAQRIRDAHLKLCQRILLLFQLADVGVREPVEKLMRGLALD